VSEITAAQIVAALAKRLPHRVQPARDIFDKTRHQDHNDFRRDLSYGVSRRMWPLRLVW
jgi:hypothetical protein